MKLNRLNVETTTENNNANKNLCDVTQAETFTAEVKVIKLL